MQLKKKTTFDDFPEFLSWCLLLQIHIRLNRRFSVLAQSNSFNPSHATHAVLWKQLISLSFSFSGVWRRGRPETMTSAASLVSSSSFRSSALTSFTRTWSFNACQDAFRSEMTPMYCVPRLLTTVNYHGFTSRTSLRFYVSGATVLKAGTKLPSWRHGWALKEVQCSGPHRMCVFIFACVQICFNSQETNGWQLPSAWL